MKHVVIIGGGTAGTCTANALIRSLDKSEFRVTVIDFQARHYYQPGFVGITIGKIPNPALWRWRRQTLLPGIHLLQERVTKVDPHSKQVITPTREIPYDYLIIATGCQCHPELVEGMSNGNALAEGIYSFYTLRWAKKLRSVLQEMESGKLIVHISEFPIRCPVAPLEFALQADWFFFQKRRRDDIEIKFVTPQSEVFQQEITAKSLSNILRLRDIQVEPDFVVRHIDAKEKRLYSYDGKIIDYDLLVTVPPMRGQQFLIDSGLADELGFVPCDIETFQHREFPDVFALGDAADLPTSKAGSAAVYQSRIFVPNFQNYVEGKPMTKRYDGHATCIVDTGFRKSTVIDLNYKTPALTGKLFIPKLGPLSLLKETRLNHLVKRLMFPFYSVLMAAPPGLNISKLQMIGKEYTRWGLRSDGKTHVAKPRSKDSFSQLLAPTYKRRPNACLAASPKAKVLQIPILQEAGGIPIDVDREGFMTKPEQWTPEVSVDLAKAMGMELTERHWDVINFARKKYFENHHISPSLRQFELAGGISIAELFDLFQFKPAKVIAFISGLPKPVGCI